MAGAKEGVNAKVKDEQQDAVPSVFVRAIRLTAITTIALLILSVMTRDLSPWPIPHWFRPLVDREIAVLTLSAGHLAFIGIHIGNKGRSDLSKSALSIAALATSFAGFRAIGETMPGNVITLMLFFLTGLAIWAEALNTNLRRIWRCAWSRKGLAAFMLVIAPARGRHHYQRPPHLRRHHHHRIRRRPAFRQVQQRTRPRAHQHRPPQLPPRPNQSRPKTLLPIAPIIPPPEAGTHPRRRAAPSPVGATGRSPWGGALPLVPSVIPALLLRHSCAEAGIHPRRRGRGGVASYPLSLSP